MPTPQFKTYQQILTALIQQFTSETNINDLNRGSVIRSLLEAAAMSDYKAQVDIMSALASVDIDRAVGIDLDIIGASKGVARLTAQPASGSVTIFQKGITKIATKIYQGTAAPPAGSLVINIADASNFPPTGAVYIGRGTANLEGAITYTSITPVGNYFQLNLASPTTKNHNTGESVILAQGGNRVIPAGTIVQTRATLTETAVQFRTVSSVILLDGEQEIKDVSVVALKTGSVGNIPSQAIVEFASPPFPNAGVTNPLAFVSGRDVMNDDNYRELIKKSEQTKTKATDLAIVQAAIGTTSNDDKKTVTSAEIKKPANREEPGVLYIDDSTGYQPIFSGQGFEPVIDNAYGGEVYLQLQQEDLVKASVVSSLAAPFALAGGMKLAVKVGGVLYEHIFSTSDFATENAVDTWEVVNSINANSNLGFIARGFDNNRRIVLSAKDFKNEDIEVVSPTVGVDANQFIGFPNTKTFTLRLYKNDEILVKDGQVPVVYSKPQSVWANSITNGATLKIKVDGAPIQAITINDSDFVPYGFATVNKNNSLASWASVLMDKIAGITVSVEGSRLKIVSNRGANNLAFLQISTDVAANSLANADNMFIAGEQSQGVTSDYALNRATGQLQLTKPLVAGDKITAGSKYTRGFIDSGEFTSGSVTLTSTPTPKLYFIVDQPAKRVNTALSSSVSVSVTNPSTNIWRYTFSSSGVIAGVQKDCWVIITDNLGLASNNVGYWRVHNVDTGNTWFEVVKTAGTVQSSIALTSANDFIFIDSKFGELQVTTLPTGVQTLATLANHIKNNILGVTAEVIGGKKIRVSTLTYDPQVGSIFMAGYNTTAGLLNFKIADYDTSSVSHTAFNVSHKDATFIEFFHDSINTGDSTVPYTTITTTSNLDTLGYEPNNKLFFLNPLNSNISSNRQLETHIAQITGVNLDLRDNKKLNEIIGSDRYFIALPFNFTQNDNIAAIIDGDVTTKTFFIKMARRLKVYMSPSATNLSAYDIDLSPTGNFPTSFGNNFDFKDFKVYFKSRVILDPNGANNKMLVRAAEYGPLGNKIKVGIFYPDTNSAGLSHSISVGGETLVNIILGSGALRTGGTWDATTEFDVTFISGSTYRYTYNGTGTAPNFLSAGIVVGDIVHISADSNFNTANKGSFKVTAITNVYFEVTNYNPGFVESNITLGNASYLKFFPLAPTNTATAIENYINTNAFSSKFISISQLESGSGIVNTSTWDDSAGAHRRVSLVDGENWILSSNIGTNITPLNQFTLKRPLNIFGSDFINEEGFIIPCTSDHVNRFLNRFAVTGLSSVSNISLAKDAKAVQIASTLFGSRGSIFVTGGTAVLTQAALVEGGVLLSDGNARIVIPASGATGFQVNQWIKYSNTEKLNKDLNFQNSTQISWDSQNPTVSKTTITIANSTASNVYRYGHFWTRRYHSGDNTTVVRLERHLNFAALVWTGTGTNPEFSKNYTITTRARSAGVSTITVSAAHGIPVGSSVWIKVSGVNVASFNGTFRAVAATTTTFEYRQDSLPNVTSGASSGTATRYVQKGDRVILSSLFNTTNAGEYVVVGTQDSHTIYLDKQDVIEETVTLSSSSDITIYDYDSVRPGDTFSVSTPVLDSTAPFESHQGVFIVDSLTSNENEIVINSLTAHDKAATTLGSDFDKVKIIEQAPFSLYYKIENLNKDPNNINNVIVTLKGSELYTKLNAVAGGSIQAVSKLGFNQAINTGEDSYKYYNGLISAVGKKIRGSATNPNALPGVLAAGAYLEINAPLAKRIQLSIVVRLKTGVPFTVIKPRVQSAVAAYVNGLGVGKPVVFSEVVSAVQSITGVQAMAISSPLYDASNDMITSQAFEKPLVFSLDQDIIVSQIT